MTTSNDNVPNRNPRVDTNGDGVPDATVAADRGQHVDPTVTPVPDRAVREEVVAREKERFGGMRFGSAFFGWLTAIGAGIVLTALVSAAGAALGFGVLETEEEAMESAETIGIIGAVAVLIILFIAYLAGGYVAGRMARFRGAKQGVAVWLWAIIIAAVVAVIGAIVGAQYDVLANLNGLPRLPINEGALTVTGVVTAVIALLVALAGAVLGGIAGMRYHRRVDRAGLEPESVV